MTKPIKPIDTPYGGHLFRSRLEARWAVFFDYIDIRWEYEPEGYELPDGTRYLPDFLIHTPQGECRWVEIKRSEVEDDPKFTAFAEAIYEPDGEMGRRAYPVLASGSPYEWLKSGNTFCPRCGMPSKEKFEEFGVIYASDNNPHETEYGLFCFPCDWETPGGGGHEPESTGVGGITWKPHKGALMLSSEAMKLWERRISTAAGVAQRARFEHGQSGEA